MFPPSPRFSEPPMIIDPPSPEVSVFLTDPRLLTLTCEAQGYPQPQVTWYHKGENQALNSLTDLFTVVVITKPVDDYSVKVESSLQFKGKKKNQSCLLIGLRMIADIWVFAFHVNRKKNLYCKRIFMCIRMSSVEHSSKNLVFGYLQFLNLK